jgi:hypothetical protein
MMLSAHRFRSIGWIALLLVCAALVMVLAFRVNALRSQVHRTEQQIVSLRKEKLYLETEVETRANQQQLKLWNDVEFGYVAPTASQYLSSERQLAAFSKPDEPDAPAPIRVASADNAVAAEAAFPSIVSRLTGEPDIAAPEDHGDDHADTHAETHGSTKRDVTTEALAPHPVAGAADHDAAAAGLGARLATVGPVKKASEKAAEKAAAGKAGASKLAKAGSAKAGSTKPGLAKPVTTHGHDGADTAHPGKAGKLTASPKAAKSAAPGKTAKSAAKSTKASKTAP